jgi:pimeloyl-ACP methyl ester carboxylesterase
MGWRRRIKLSCTERYSWLCSVLVTMCVVSVFLSPLDGQAQRSDLSRGSAVQLESCGIKELPDARCGKLSVFENRKQKTGRQIALNIVIVPATEPIPGNPPIFWLDGGPGGAATEAADYVSLKWLRVVHRDHAIVFIDERGTGKSGPLQCGDIGEDPKLADAFFGKPFPPELVAACRDELQKAADLRFYTTELFVDDVNEVRQAFNYSQINLAAFSYGTLAAQEYMRRYPSQVRSAFLFGLVSPGYRLPLPFAETAERALEQLWRDCAADMKCHQAFPNVQQEFREVLKRFGKGNLKVEMIDPATQAKRLFQLSRSSYIEHVREMLYSTGSASFVPFVIHKAFEGDFVPFGVRAARSSRGGGGSYAGLHFSKICSEAIPFISSGELARATRNTFLGDSRVMSYSDVCKIWPRGDVSRSFLKPIKTAIPILVFSGEEDPVTPPWLAEDAIRRWPNARQVSIPQSGHQFDSQCEFNIVAAFYKTGSARNLDTSCIEKTKRPPFALSLPMTQINPSLLGSNP